MTCTPNTAVHGPNEELADGALLQRCKWSAMSRARSRVTRTGDNLIKWGLKTDPRCEYGEATQSIDHALNSSSLSPNLVNSDLFKINQRTLKWLTVWCDKL